MTDSKQSIPFYFGLKNIRLQRDSNPVRQFTRPAPSSLSHRDTNTSELNVLRKIICLRKSEVSVERISFCNFTENFVEHIYLFLFINVVCKGQNAYAYDSEKPYTFANIYVASGVRLYEKRNIMEQNVKLWASETG